MVAHCHVAVAKVAKEIAENLYEVVMSNNEVRARWKLQNPDCTEKQLIKRFVDKNWGKCLEPARATLVGLLNGPLPDHLKEEVVDILYKDSTLMRGRERAQMRVLDYKRKMN